MTRVLGTVELEGDAVRGDRVVLRDEHGGELAAVPVRGGVDGADVGGDLLITLVHEMRSLAGPEE